MATIAITIKKPEQKQDGTWRVKFRLTHERKVAYINTDIYVDRSQLTKSLEIKDQDVYILLNDYLKKYRNKLASISTDHMNVKELKDEITKKDINSSNIDFIELIDDIRLQRTQEGRTGDLNMFRTVRNRLVDYFGSKSVPISKITSQMLFDYERHLKMGGIFLRRNKHGEIIEFNAKKLETNGIIKQMVVIRTVFNEGLKRFNNPDTGYISIPHYPIIRYKIAKPKMSKHRVLSNETFSALSNHKPRRGSAKEMAKEIFLLSFYMCGMNAVDILKLPKYNGEKRIEYNRSKTKDSRNDNAFISVKVTEEAKPLLKKWAGKIKYANREYFIRAINDGLKSMGFEFTFYYARHTFATWAQRSGAPISDIAIALNHVNSKYKITGVYVEPDWSIIDKVQSSVIEYAKNIILAK